MRLKKLVLVGFKSFADKTTLHFDPGITCIVGPNGCGKSNIADAFRWVLGEQSAKSMRGNKMPDVIFAGTQHRKPLNMAEVSLTLTDIKGEIPIDYEEITLTRRLHRSGESEYFINGNQVRLKDVQSLFLDSGVGRNTFSVFEQGKLDQVIQYSPLERRYIFEEAAGILRFLQRKREALKRLEQADLNLSRVKDIHHEVHKQIKLLEQQAVKAKEFKENKLLLEGLEKAVFVLRWNLLEKKWIEADGRQAKQQEFLEGLTQTLTQMQAKTHETKIMLEKAEGQLRAKSDAFFKCRSDKEIQAREYASNQTTFQELDKKEKKIKQEIEGLSSAQQIRQKSLLDLKQKLNAAHQDFHDAQNKLNTQQEKVKLKEKEVGQLRQDWQARQQQQMKFVQNESRLDSECKQQEVRLENNKERKKTIESRKGFLERDMTALTQLALEKKQQLNQASLQVDAQKERLQQYEESLKKIQFDTEKKQKEIETIRRKIVEHKARQKVLLKMREDHEGFSSGSKKLLQAASDKNHRLFNKIHPLYEYLNPIPEVAEALTVILRSYSHTLVVESKEDFNEILRHAQENKLQDYSLICLDWVNEVLSKSEKGESSFLKQVSQHPLSRHFLQHVRQLNEQTHFASFSGYEEWHPSIGFFDRYGVFFDARPQDNHVFLRQSELKNLEEELVEKEEELKRLEKTLQDLQQTKNILQTERAETDKALRRDEMKLVEINFGLQKALGDQEKIKLEGEQIEKEHQVLELQIQEQSAYLQQLQNQYLAAKQDLARLQQEMESIERELDAQSRALRVQQQDHREKGSLYHKLSEDKQQLMHQISLLELKEQEHQKNQERLKEEIEETLELKDQIKVKEKEAQKALEALDHKLNELKEARTISEKEVSHYKEQLEQLDKEIQEQNQKIKQAETELAQWNLQSAQHRSTAQGLAQELQERYQLTIEEAKEMMPESIKSLDHTEKQIRSLRQSLQAAGDVNLTSIEELDKHQVRYQFLSQQMADMTASKEELLKLIEQLDEESRQLFKETFEAIRANFKKNFQILFNGGEADLHFTETNNILEAGIEISAKPPGKHMRSITLLSGGEKCLTAVALLFAIFEVKPAPFCILDEIDAPLDDANIERFVNVVKHFVDRCQFLIVTHNKRTMAIGDILFGISMEEKGVSKLLSLEFAHETAPALVEE